MGIRFGQYLLLTQERKLLGPNGIVEVGARSFDILVLLLERSNSVVSKDALLDAVWPNLTVEENTLQVHISALRKRIGNSSIRTVHGRGYKYSGPEPRHVDEAPSDQMGRAQGPDENPDPSPGTFAHNAKAMHLPLPDKPSVAVLPFANLSGDVLHEYFASGITDSIIAGLTHFRGPPFAMQPRHRGRG